MNQANFALSLVVLFLFVPVVETAAQSNANLESCERNEGDASISACTRLITIGQLSPGKLAIAYILRGNAWMVKRDYDRAIADYNDSLLANPQNEMAFYNRANVWFEKGDYDLAITDYSQALGINPGYAGALNNRGNAWYRKQDYNRAIADYSEAIRLDPASAESYLGRSSAQLDRGNFVQSLLDVQTYIQSGGNKRPAAMNRIAKLLAAAPFVYRDGTRAVEFALRANEMSNWSNSDYIETLAAAYAEKGDFNEAVRWQSRAIQMAAKPEDAASQRLSLYKQKQPYRIPHPTMATK